MVRLFLNYYVSIKICLHLSLFNAIHFLISTGEVALYFKISPLHRDFLPGPLGMPLFEGVPLPTHLPAPFVMEPKVLSGWDDAKDSIRAVLTGIDAVIYVLTRIPSVYRYILLLLVLSNYTLSMLYAGVFYH